MLIEEKTKFRIALIFLFLYLVCFGFYTFWAKNFEFFYYSLILLFLVYFIFFHERARFPLSIFLAFILFSLLSFFGGNIYINHIRLFECYLPGGIIRYDNFIHAFGSAIIVLAANYFLKGIFSNSHFAKNWYKGFILVLIGLGIGSATEIIEFGSVLIVKNTGVGDYFNNAWDQVFNFAGSLLAVLIIRFWPTKPKLKP